MLGADTNLKTQAQPYTQSKISSPKSTILTNKGTKSSNLLGARVEQKASNSTPVTGHRTQFNRNSPPDFKGAGFSPSTGSPPYKNRMEERVKVGFIVTNGPVVGMHVTKVTQKLPADLAGLKVGDIIHVINGHQTLRVEDFRLVASSFRAGDVVPMKITRVEDGVPRNINLIMRIPAAQRDPLVDNASPQKESARELKAELARLKEEKERREREAIEKLRKEKQRIASEKKAKDLQMREELEKRKAAARLKRVEMKRRQEQLKNEEVVLLQELRARRAARRQEILAQSELTEKQKNEEFEKIQEEEQKWAQIIEEEEKHRLQEQKLKHEEIKKLKEEQKKKKRRTRKSKKRTR